MRLFLHASSITNPWAARRASARSTHQPDIDRHDSFGKSQQRLALTSVPLIIR